MHTQRKNVVTNKTQPTTHGIDEKAKTLIILLLYNFWCSVFLVFGDGIQLVVVQHTGITVEELGILGVCFGIRDWYLVGVGAI